MDPAQGPHTAPARATSTEAGFSAEDWSAYLTQALDNPVTVSFGHARRQVVQCRGFWKDPRGRPIEVRLSGFFRLATPDVRAALGTWLRHGQRSPRASELLDAFIAEALRELPPRNRRAAAAETQGLVHDLAPHVKGLVNGPVAEFAPLDFSPRGLPAVGWGRRQLSRARRSLQLGAYSEDQHGVRLHPVLDQAGVPPFFLRYVLFHELLHAVRSIARANDARRLHHDAAFRRREAAYPDFATAQAWQRANVAALLRSAKTGRAFAPRR